MLFEWTTNFTELLHSRKAKLDGIDMGNYGKNGKENGEKKKAEDVEGKRKA